MPADHINYVVPTILQWNCRGLQAKISELSLYLQRVPIPILAFSEAGLPDNRSIAGYETYCCPSISTFPNGSAALYVRRELPRCQIPTDSLNTADAEFVAVKVSFKKTTIMVMSIYIRPGREYDIMDAFEDWCNQHKPNLVVCGDFNAHHTLWGSDSIDSRGRRLEEIFSATQLSIANTGGPTFFRPPSTFSALDVTAYDPTLKLSWKIAPDTMGSDHFPISITLPECSKPNTKSYRVTNWDEFRNSVSKSTAPIVTTILCALMLNTKVVRLPDHFPSPDLKLLNLTAARRRAQRRLRRHPTSSNRTTFNRISATLRRYANHLRRSQWWNFCEELSAHTPGTKVWKIIRSLTGDRCPIQPFETLALAMSKTIKELAEDFARTYEGKPTVSPVPPTANISSNPLDDAFTTSEFTTALRQCRRRSATGRDGISYQALQNLPLEGLTGLLQFFNSIWMTGKIPEEWKMSIIVPILKPGKPSYDPCSYRPVALTSCVAKLMERMIQNRMTWFLEKHQLLPNEMTGFRQGLCATDSILDLISSIEDARARRQTTLAIFFDVEKAFDTVNVGSILRRLTFMGITGRIQTFLANFLSGRQFQVRLGTTLSSIHGKTRGLPQGSILSPILFNLAMAGLPQEIPPGPIGVNCSIYADDVCLWASHLRRDILRRSLQPAITSVQLYLATVGLEISVSKTAYMFFPHIQRRSCPNIDL